MGRCTALLVLVTWVLVFIRLDVVQEPTRLRAMFWWSTVKGFLFLRAQLTTGPETIAVPASGLVARNKTEEIRRDALLTQTNRLGLPGRRTQLGGKAGRLTYRPLTIKPFSETNLVRLMAAPSAFEPPPSSSSSPDLPVRAGGQVFPRVINLKSFRHVASYAI